MRLSRLRPILVALGALAALGAGACTLLAPTFTPSVGTDSMSAQGIQSRFASWVGPSPAPGEVHYTVAGRAAGGPRVLFVHGSPGTWEAFRGYLTDAKLSAAARLIAPDRPGFGGTRRGRAEPSLELQAAAVASALDAEPGEPAVVVGHSLGGPIALRLAVDRPDLVGALLLVAPSIDPALERRRWYNRAGSWRAVQWLLPVDWIASNRELWPLRAELEELAPRLREVRAPTLVIQGEEDDLVPPENADYAERALVGASPLEIRRVPGEGHFLLWTRGELVGEAILEALERGRRAVSATGGVSR